MVDRGAIERLVRRQHGTFSRHQLLELGVTPSQIHSRLASGSWSTLASGVYTPSTSLPTWERQLHAAILSHPGSVAAGLSAAHLLGFAGVRKGRPEIMMPFTGNGRSDIARVIRSRHFDTIDRRIVDGLECTSPAETTLTLSMRWPFVKVEQFVDDGLAGDLLSIKDFDPILERLAFARQPGLRALRAIIGARAFDAYQPPTSELERLLFVLLDHPKLPRYTRQLPITYPTTTATVDAYIHEWSLIVEGDGRRWHTRKADFEVDRERDNSAVATGLAVVRFTWKSLRYEPETCLRTLLAAGNRRSMM